MDIKIAPIGKITAGKSFAVELNLMYAPGLLGLEGFSHVMIVWYANKSPAWNESALRMDKPYRLAPERLGVFATRSPYRPNGICVSVAAVASIDEKKGIVKLWWTDAENGTPVIDIKPYHPSGDIVRDYTMPAWCAHWPKCQEESADFAWNTEFLF